MSWTQPADFAEGDSGVAMQAPSIQIWNDIEMEKQRKAEQAPAMVHRNPVEFLAELAGKLLAIGSDKSNDPLARATALLGAHTVLMDQMRLQQIAGGKTDAGC